MSDDQETTHFSPELKQEAARLVLDQGYGILQACCSLGVGESALRRWAGQMSQEREGVTPKGKALTPEQRKTKGFEVRCKRLEMEKTVLKKAMVSSTGRCNYFI